MTPLLPASFWPTLHRLATGEAWPPSGAAADRLVARASREALLPLLFAEADPPSPLRAALDRARALERVNARRTEILTAAMQRVAEILQGQPVLFLKGADYRYRLYPRPELRPMQDVDILVPRADVPAVARALEAAGLRPIPTGGVTELSSHHEKLFRLGHVSVDVHQSFLQRPRSRVDYAAVWARRVPLQAPGVPAGRLDDTDAVVYHAVAMAADEFRGPLLRYVDLWRMVAADASLAEAAVARAREWAAERALYGAFRLAARVFPELAGLGVTRALEGLLAPRARRFLDAWVLPDPWEHGDGRRPGRRVQLWRKFWLIDGLARRAGFALYHGRAVWQARRAARARRAVAGSGRPPA